MLILVKDFSNFDNFRYINLTSKNSQISTRWSQAPDKGIRTLSCKCCTQEVFDDSQFSGNIEGSQTDVLEHMICFFLLKIYARILHTEILNLSTCADSSSNTKKSIKIKNYKFSRQAYVSGATCYILHVSCHLTHVTSANSHSHRPSPC